MGNILATVSDKKSVTLDGGGPVPFFIAGYEAEVITVQDYYPFGASMPGRSLNLGEYRFEFNGKEADGEISGDGNSYDFGARAYDSRVGRFLSTDPLTMKFASISTYNFAAGSPILLIDNKGENPSIPPAQDPRLALTSLLKNPDYQGLTVFALRRQVSRMFSNLDSWEVNISAGNALEMAYAEFTAGLKRGTNNVSYKGNNLFNMRIVRPDFVHSTDIKDPQGRVLYFPYGGAIEVKASQYPIKLTTNDGQIDAELNLVKNAGAAFFRDELSRAGEKRAASFTLVLPMMEQLMIGLGSNRTGCYLYVQYAFQNKETGAIVFSTLKN
ncbi:MAG: RHS repeat-associated core domain-containing protein [Bacteroidia bacterium]